MKNVPFGLPRFFPILDAGLIRKRLVALQGGEISSEIFTSAIVAFAVELAAGGATLIQYRNKTGNSKEMLSHGRELRRMLGLHVRLIMNDRPDLALEANFDGVHVGQDDLNVASVRKILGPNLIVGTSTHNPTQVADADRTDATYVAIGPVFGTFSKENPDPVVGLEGVKKARALTNKPLIAIGGITRESCLSVVGAGADAVAVISDLLESPRRTSQQFCRILL